MSDRSKVVDLTRTEGLALLDRLISADVAPEDREMRNGIVRKFQEKDPSLSRKEREWLLTFIPTASLTQKYKKVLKDKLSADMAELWQDVN